MATGTTFVDPLETLVTRLRLHGGLSDDDAAAISSLPYTLIHRRPNVALARQGDLTNRCHVLVEGFVQRHRLSQDGQRQILAIYVPGDPVDFDQLYLPEADDTLQTLRDCTLAVIEHDELRSLVRERPAIGEGFVRAMLVDASIFREWILNVGRRDARTRIAHLLCEISAKLQAQHFDFANIPLPLTQEQLADARGLTSVHVNRTLKSLKRDGWIERRGGLVLLPNPIALRSLAGFDVGYLHLRS